MDCYLAGAKPLTEPVLEYCQLYPWEQTMSLYLNLYIFIHENTFENNV